MKFIFALFVFFSFDSFGQAWIKDSSLIIKCLNEDNMPYQDFSLKIDGVQAEPCGFNAAGPVEPGYYRVKPFTQTNDPLSRFYIEASAAGYMSLADSIYPMYQWGLFKHGDDYFYLNGNRIPKVGGQLLSGCLISTVGYDKLMDAAILSGAHLLFLSNDCDDFFGEVSYAQYAVFSHPSMDSFDHFRQAVPSSFEVYQTRGKNGRFYKISTSAYFRFLPSQVMRVNEALNALRDQKMIDSNSFDSFMGNFCFIHVAIGKEFYFNEIFNFLSDNGVASMCSVEIMATPCPD
ncbi:MAG: hypothetical protein R2809_01635 [Flavobacteriales bacterium]